MRPRTSLLLALAASFLIGSFLPFGGVILYPITLLATWVHEMGHGLAALVLGGHFSQLEIFSNASGLALTTAAGPKEHAIVAFTGLVAPPIAGAAIFVVVRGPARARGVLLALAAALAVSTLVWVRSVTGVVVLPIVAVALGFIALRSHPHTRFVVAQFLALRFAIDTLSRIGYVWTDDAVIDGVRRASDIATVAAGFGGPRFVWSLLVSLLSLVLVAGGLVAAWRRPSTPSRSR